MTGSYWSALLVVWLWQIWPCLSYTYELKPQVTFEARGTDAPDLVIVGSFAIYGEEKVGREYGAVALVDTTYGCPGSNDTKSNSVSGKIVVLEISAECDDYLQARRASEDNAKGVVFYYTSSSSKSALSLGDDILVPIPVAVVELWGEIADHLTGRRTPAYTNVVIEGKHFAVAPQQRTFYFIVTAFCILILLSCLWFFTSYFRRCRYSLRNRRSQVSRVTAASVWLVATMSYLLVSDSNVRVLHVCEAHHVVLGSHSCVCVWYG